MFLISLMMCLIMYFCVFGAIVEAMLIEIVFFIQEMGRFCIFFYIDVNVTIT